jgi:hypothetical protein
MADMKVETEERPGEDVHMLEVDHPDLIYLRVVGEIIREISE